MRACKEFELRIDFSAQVDTNNDIKKKKNNIALCRAHNGMLNC